ncbi:monovalent cation/H(+) antiporter subunit G [Halobacillus shinanisalinarum]|uniref:Monovalent cation/H(+) antiporter subunit G n=1 Tax=Halobacillus shinanisalinarum TaxID=2932258 RepID=A0ABY4H0F9_9BACI|nr:monovalent cation/H(+) antiporter subunit G [Halobacillus shinanisalinarum]UOQ93814.1 monovalent cation/H(+) antiporter subunit G [Halobacillus shinanisalinarum]
MSETWINVVLDILICISLLMGTFFFVSTSIGILRFPDVYTRLHAATKGSTLGITGVLIGSFLFMYVEHGIISGKLLLGILFILLTAPVTGHVLGRAAYYSGVPLSDKSVEDEYKKNLEKVKDH